MNLTEFTNHKDVKAWISEMLSLPETDPHSPWMKIPRDQFYHYRLAVAYEEGKQIESDHVYDMHTKYLQRQQVMFPDIWEKVSLQCFRNGDWEFTGSFIYEHNKDDEAWLL